MWLLGGNRKANINKIRKELLDLVDDFTKTKAPFFAVLLEKRRLAELEAARAEADALEALRVMAEEPDDGVGTPGPRKKSMPGTPMSAGMIRSGRGSRPNSDGLGCSINCGKADTNLVVVSKVMRANSRYTRAMPSKKKQVVDYCFLDDYNLADDELLFSAGNAILDRSDILSTKPDDYTELRVIAAWSVVLNFMEVKEKEAPVMMFLGTQHMEIFEEMLEQAADSDDVTDSQKDKVVQSWSHFLGENVVNSEIDVDLVFIPLSLEKYYFCVCVNFMNETENKKKEGVVINTFTFVNVDFEWKATIRGDKESGFYTMFHMLTYERKHEQGLYAVNKKCERIPIWLEMVAILLMSDVNESRASLLEQMGTFRRSISEVEKELIKFRRSGKKRIAVIDCLNKFDVAVIG
ncbi:uncharacterized protein LOC141646260 [Silene latifolia]|uniref:uncharacterized protein LOC141646260 n=1 Tax=Silene latifolia TaxID=37657 RepID=UPI003D784F0F